MNAFPHILALQLKRIGDAILTAPALARMRERFPGARITLVLDRAAGPLADAFTAADEVLVYRHRPRDLGLWLRLLVEPFDLCLDFTGTDRSAAMCRLSGARNRLGYAKFSEGRIRRHACTGFCRASVRDLHTVDFHLALADEGAAQLDAAGGEGMTGNSMGATGFAPPATARQRAQELLEEAACVTGDDAPAAAAGYAVVHPGTARQEKYWLPGRWAEVIRHLSVHHGLRVVMTGGSDPSEVRHLEAVRREAADVPIIDLAGTISLIDLAGVIAGARIAVGVDSAAMHLAAMSGTPQVVFFGPTNPFHWRPRHPRAAVVRPPFHGPLAEADFAPRSPAQPMRALSTETAIRAIDLVLDRDPRGEMPVSGRASVSSSSE